MKYLLPPKSKETNAEGFDDVSLKHRLQDDLLCGSAVRGYFYSRHPVISISPSGAFGDSGRCECDSHDFHLAQTLKSFLGSKLAEGCWEMKLLISGGLN